MKVSVAPAVATPLPTRPLAEFQDKQGRLYVGEDLGNGKFANIRLVPSPGESGLDVVLDPGLLDVSKEKNPVAMRVLTDVFFYDMIVWLAVAAIGFFIFAFTSRLTPLLHPVALMVAIIVASLVFLVGMVAAATVRAMTLWTRIALVAYHAVFILFAVTFRVVAPVQYSVMQWAVSLSILLYVVRVRSHVDTVALKKTIGYTAGVAYLLGIFSYKTSAREWIAAAIIAIPFGLSCIRRYWWIIQMIEKNEFTINDDMRAWENSYTQSLTDTIDYLFTQTQTPSSPRDETTISFSQNVEL